MNTIGDHHIRFTDMAHLSSMSYLESNLCLRLSGNHRGLHRNVTRMCEQQLVTLLFSSQFIPRYSAKRTTLPYIYDQSVNK
jgi:hypothetical protein